MNMPMIPAPSNIVTESLEPDTKKAITIPGNTACEMASPTIAILRRIKKLPSNAQLADTSVAVNMMKRSFIVQLTVYN